MSPSSASGSHLHRYSRMDRTEMEAIVAGTHAAPANILGLHRYETEAGLLNAVRVFRPLDQAVWIRTPDDGQEYAARRLHRAGFHECLWPSPAGTEAPVYRLRLLDREGQIREIEDPYRFPPSVTDYEHHLFAEGKLRYSWRRMGAHPHTIDRVAGVQFAVWAPNALRTSVIGPFNAWDERVHPMHVRQGGIWELFIPHLEPGAQYKFSILSSQGHYRIDKMDPYGFHCTKRPDTLSRVWALDRYRWQDGQWMQERAARQTLEAPLSIYEVHLGSWKRSSEDNCMLSYRELAHQLAAYCRRMGYTHIELMPVMEHPLDESWGYQVTGYYAPTSRFGDPDDFRYFVDHCHQQGIGVLLDWVPAHFPKDGHGLVYFDGTHLYEHEDPRQGEHREWNTRIFNFGRNEIRNFLLSNALFWLKEYHIDGFRVDAVASMLYLNYAREEGDWVPNRHGGPENIEAIEFLREFNRIVHMAHPGVLTIAEESTSWPLVTYPDYVGGLGFDLKWNMGWMHDTLAYFSLDPIFRKFNQNLLTFGLTYAHAENFVLAFSHDEVVHLKKSQLGKMPGERWQQFANLRLLATCQYGHPGKKLNFMGNEFAQDGEWSEARSLDWPLLKKPLHRQFHAFMEDLGQLYLQLPALWLKDSEQEGFAWIEFRDVDNTVVSFARYGHYPEDTVVIVLNMTPIPRRGYCIGMPGAGPWHEILNSDAVRYGGSGLANEQPLVTEAEALHGFDYRVTLTLPPLAGLMLSPRKPATAHHSELPHA